MFEESNPLLHRENSNRLSTLRDNRGAMRSSSWIRRRRRPSINFVICHDGFILDDIVSYDRKHNEATSDNNQDGAGHNISGNCCAEGIADDLNFAWVNPDGTAMNQEQWNTQHVRCFGVVLFGDCTDLDEEDEEIRGDSLLILFNADHAATVSSSLPEIASETSKERLFDTFDPNADEVLFTSSYELRPCSMTVFRRKSEDW